MGYQSKRVSKKAPKVKRIRQSLSCTVCRRRKVKCDRGRPFCDVCRRHKITDQCHYDTPLTTDGMNNTDSDEADDLPSGSAKGLKKIMKKMKELEQTIYMESNKLCDKEADSSNEELIKKYDIESTDIINLNTGTPALFFWYLRMNNHGPLAWFSIILRDPFLSTIFYQVVSHFRKNAFSIPPFAKIPITTPTVKDDEFTKSFLEYSGMNEVRPLRKLSDQSVIPSPTQKKPTIEFIKLLNHTLLQILPTKKVIFLLLDRFFLYCYPFMPYFDQPEFMSEIENLIGKRVLAEVPVTNVHFKRRMDIATIGSLLYMLKISTLSLESNYSLANDFPARTKIELYLLNHPISSKTTTVADMCLDQFPVFRRYALSIYQCLLSGKEYENTKCSDSFGDGRMQIYLSYLVQLATSSGLNRDPDTIRFSANTESHGCLLRKIWYSLNLCSTLQSVMFGFPLVVRDDSYDTKLPTFVEDHLSGLNAEVEKQTIKDMSIQYNLARHLNKILEKVLNIKNSVQIVELITDLETLDAFVRKDNKTLGSILTPTDGNHCHNIAKVKAIMNYVEALSLIHPIYYHLMLYYEGKHKPQTAYCMCIKVLEYAMEIFAHFTRIFKHSYRYFGVGFDFYLATFFETAVQKCLQIQIALYVRAYCLREKLDTQQSQNRPLIEKINQFLSRILQHNFHDNFVRGVLPMASKSYFAWILLRGPSFIFSKMRDDAFQIDKKQYNFLEDLSESQLTALFDATDITAVEQKCQPTSAMPMSGAQPNQGSNSSGVGTNDISTEMLEKMLSSIIREKGLGIENSRYSDSGSGPRSPLADMWPDLNYLAPIPMTPYGEAMDWESSLSDSANDINSSKTNEFGELFSNVPTKFHKK